MKKKKRGRQYERKMVWIKKEVEERKGEKGEQNEKFLATNTVVTIKIILSLFPSHSLVYMYVCMYIL